MTDLLVGTTLVSSFLAGIVALFAPCCISVMLPAYFASSFRRRSALLSMTGVFALGVAAIILPIALGAAAISRTITAQHFLVFLAGGVLMMAMGVATVLGRQISLPMIRLPRTAARTPIGVFTLGAFSGVASACCAPVLAGVIALSGTTASFVTAMAIGIAYVFGMVIPLLVIALLWDRFNWGTSPILRGRMLRIPIAPGRRLAVHTTALASAVLLLAMGALIVVSAFRGPDMAGGGWQASVSAWVQHIAHVVTTWLVHVPGWLSGLALLVALALVVRKAVRQAMGAANHDAAGPGGSVRAGAEPAATPSTDHHRRALQGETQ